MSVPKVFAHFTVYSPMTLHSWIVPEVVPYCKPWHIWHGAALCRTRVIVNFLTLTLADIDECGTTQAGNCEHRCGNTFGSYQCYCNEGYSVEGSKCKRKYDYLTIELPDTLSYIYTNAHPIYFRVFKHTKGLDILSNLSGNVYRSFTFKAAFTMFLHTWGKSVCWQQNCVYRMNCAVSSHSSASAEECDKTGSMQ